MAIKTSPSFGGGGGGGGGGLKFPLVGPPGSAGNESYAFTTGGGMHGTPAGGVALSVAAMDALTADPSGDINIAKALLVAGLAQLNGGLATTALSAATGTFTSNVSVGGALGVSGSAQITGDLSARKITASGALSAASIGTTGGISGASLSIVGQATLRDLKVSGTFQAEQIASEGPLLFPTTSSMAPGLGLLDQPSTGIFGAPNTLGFAIAGQTALSIGAQLDVTLHGALIAAAVTADSLAVTSLQVSGGVTLQDVSANNVAIAANLSVMGNTRLANLLIDRITTDHDLSVGGSASVTGALQVGGNVSAQGSASFAGLNVGGTANLGALMSGRTEVSVLRIVLAQGGGTPVDSRPIPGGTIDYGVLLDNSGSLALTNNLTAFGSALIGGGLTAGGGTFNGSVTVGQALSVTGLLSSAQEVKAPLARIGGSVFQAGHGSPEGNLLGSPGDRYSDLDAGLLYLKLAGQNSKTGWSSVSTAATAAVYPARAPASQPSSGPQFAFVTSGGDGLGSTGAGNVYLATNFVSALSFDINQAATFSAGLSATSVTSPQGTFTKLDVSGDSTLAGLRAGSTSVGVFTAAAATISGPLLGSTLQLSDSASIGSGLSVTGAATAASLKAPLFTVGSARVTSGSGDPNGQVGGSPGDVYIDQGGAHIWVKASGTNTNTGWGKVPTSADPSAFPMTAPDGSAASPSYGFSGQKGLSVVGGRLAGIVGGQVGYSLGADLGFQLAGNLSVSGNTFVGALSAAAINAASIALSGNAQVNGVLSAGSVQTGGIIASQLSASGPIAGTTVLSNGATWRAGTAQPADNVGQAGDFSSVIDSSSAHPLVVKVGSAWRALALVGDPVPSNFPLRGPTDSASAPNFAPSAASPSTGMFSAGTNSLGFSTAGTQAAIVDANQNWAFAAGLTGGAASFSNLTVNGSLGASGPVTFGNTLQVSGAVTLASTLGCGTITSSGAINAASAALSGLLTAQSAQTTGDVTIGGNLQVNGTTVYNGVQRVGYIQTGDGTVSSPAVSFTAEPSMGAYRPSSGVWALAIANGNVLTIGTAAATFAAAVRIGGTNAGLISPGTNSVAIQTAGNTALSFASSGIGTFQFQSAHIAGSAASPGVAVGGSTTGLFAGQDNANRAIVGVTQGGVAVARFASFVNNSTAVYLIGLGDPSSASVSGGLAASAQLPSTGAPLALPGMLYQDTRGGQAPLWVNESTTSTPSFAKVLTTSSPVSPSFPVVGPAGSASAPTFAVSSANTGMFSVNLGSTIPTTASFAQGGRVIGNFYGYTTAGSGAATPLSCLALGDASTTNIGIISMGAITPNGNAGGYGGSLHVFPNQGAGKSLWLNEGTASNSSAWGAVYSSLTPQLAGSTGSAAAPYHSFAGSLGSGLWSGVDAFSTSVVNLAVGGTNVAIFKQIPTNSLPLFAFALGNVASSTINGGLIASNQAPTGIGAFPSQLYQDTRGGSGCLYVCEATSNSTTGWAKVLTSSSVVSPTFPILAPSGTAAAPSYSYSASPGSGFLYTVDAGATNAPAPAISVAGKVVAFFTQSTVNSLPVYNLCLGDPTVSASPYNGSIRSSQQAANGNIVAAPGQIAINPSGGAGTVLAVKETGVGTNTGWSFIYTQGTTQLAGQNGTLAAPYFSFSGDKTSGLYNGDQPYMVHGGKQAIGFNSNIAGMGYSGLTFGAGNTDGNPYMFALTSGAASAGNPNTLAIPAARAALMLNAAGAAGDQLWIHEPTSSSSGWVRVLSENTQISQLTFKQISSVTNVSGLTKIWADTNNLVRVGIFLNSSSAPTLKQEIVGTPYGASQTITVANNNSQIVLTNSTQYTLTLPAGSSTIDLTYKFHTESSAGVVIKASTGQTIAYGNQQSTSGGTLTTSALGSYVELYLRAGGTIWISRGAMGSWTPA